MGVLGLIFIAWCVHHGDHELETVSLPCVVLCLATRFCRVCIWCVRAWELAVCQPEGLLACTSYCERTSCQRDNDETHARFLLRVASMFLKKTIPACFTYVTTLQLRSARLTHYLRYNDRQECQCGTCTNTTLHQYCQPRCSALSSTKPPLTFEQSEEGAREVSRKGKERRRVLRDERGRRVKEECEKRARNEGERRE